MTFSAATIAQKQFCCGAGPKLDFETSTLCDEVTGDPVLVVSSIDAATGIPTPLGYNLDGSPYVGNLTKLVQCADSDVESDPVTMCDGGTVTFLRWFLKRDGVIESSFDTSLAGLPYATVGVVTPGECVAPATQAVIQTGGNNIASGTFTASHDPQNQGPTWNYAGGGTLQAVSVNVHEAGTPGSGNSVLAVFPNGNVLYLLQGETKSWSVAQDSQNVAEILDQGISIQCIGNAAATVSWTEQV